MRDLPGFRVDQQGSHVRLRFSDPLLPELMLLDLEATVGPWLGRPVTNRAIMSLAALVKQQLWIWHARGDLVWDEALGMWRYLLRGRTPFWIDQILDDAAATVAAWPSWMRNLRHPMPGMGPLVR